MSQGKMVQVKNKKNKMSCRPGKSPGPKRPRPNPTPGQMLAALKKGTKK